MNLFIEEHADTEGVSGGDNFAFWVDGDLQFDTRDEAIYHEALALPALTLARQSCRQGHPLRVLICGGGDGLALREVVRFPDVAHVDLVDYSPEIVELGKTRFADLNRHAFNDKRVGVHINDAWEFLQNNADPYDVILCDFTTPRQEDDARIMTRDWYELVARALSPQGVAGINAVSPQTAPEAFWCLHRTVRAGGLKVVPFRACIPSFRAQGYGTWAFLLAGHKRLRRADLRNLQNCPVETTATDMGRLWEAAAFTKAERLIEGRVPVHTLEAPCLLPLLLNPGKNRSSDAAYGELPPLERLMSAIPVLHPYHTRLMVESLASQVVGSVQALDLRRLVDALLARVGELPETLRAELHRLRDFLHLKNAPHFSHWNQWAQRLFAIIAVIMTLANLVSPDNAFGKGSFGLGHASVSRGYSGRSFGGGSFSRSGSASSGYAASGRTGGGSFSASGSFGRPTVTSSRPSEPITGRGFRGEFQRGQPTDIFGNSYSPRTFVYYHGGGMYHSGSGNNGIAEGSPQTAPTQQQARFVADDDMMVMENGDVVITLSDSAFLVVSGGSVSLHSKNTPDPLLLLYADPLLFDNITARLRDQKAGLQKEMNARREWLQWVGWTRPVFSSVQGDKAELDALEDLDKRLDAALVRVGSSPRKDAPPDLPADLSPNAIELFSGGGLLQDGRVALIDVAGRYEFTDGKTIVGANGNQTPVPCSPFLASALDSVLVKLEKEFNADLTELAADTVTLQSDKTSLQTDLQEYTSLFNANGADYEVDYGTDTLSAQEALNRTNADIAQNAKDIAEAATMQTTLTAQITRLHTAAEAFKTPAAAAGKP